MCYSSDGKEGEFCQVAGALAFCGSIWVGSLEEGAWDVWTAEQTEVLVLGSAVAHGGQCHFLRPKTRPR